VKHEEEGRPHCAFIHDEEGEISHITSFPEACFKDVLVYEITGFLKTSLVWYQLNQNGEGSAYVLLFKFEDIANEKVTMYVEPFGIWKMKEEQEGVVE